MTSASPRAQLIHIETDRRLGHEWEEWDGKPLPGNGDFSAPPGVFFRYAGVTLALVAAGTAALIFVLAPRLAAVATGLPDRKSTRLNSSHLVISYAVFCLKKKKKEIAPGQAGQAHARVVGVAA